jgi:predicted transposase YbfD/YdcC
MEDTQFTVAVTTPTGTLTLPVPTLVAAFASVPDPRRAQGRRFSLPALLSLLVTALLCNHLSVLAMAEWGQTQAPDIQAALGFTPGRLPHQSTLHRFLRKLDPAALATALQAVFDPCVPEDSRPRGSEGVAVDGKCHRGQLRFAPASHAPIHEVNVFSATLGVLLTQVALNLLGDKATAELSAAPAVLEQVDWHGRVLTGDALWCEKAVCAGVVAGGGDYAVVVKGDQPTLYEEIRVLFEPPAMELPGEVRAPWEHRETRTVEKGHGRLEVRQACASSELVGYSRWPHLAQVLQVRRTWQEQGQQRQAVHYVVTSLPVEVADVGRLLALRRGHWSVENRLHYIKDVSMGEDKSLIHEEAGPAVMGLLRGVVISVLHRAGHTRIASRLRYHSTHPQEALAFLGLAS